MSSLPPALNFAETEEEIVKKWKEEKSFQLQNELSIERGDEVSSRFRRWFCFSIER
jgi:isoleucyl-tRNA synthetase